jgi:hypothetical protein
MNHNKKFQMKRVEKTMNRWIQALTCFGAFAATSTVSGWGGSVPKSAPEPYLESDFPMNPDQQWYMKESYLIMKPYEDDNDYATKLKTQGALGSSLDMHMKLEKPDFDWFSGVRIGIGRYLANHDKWDISLVSTYFYANEESSSSPVRGQGNLLTPLWSPTFDGGATKGQVDWRLNYFTWDISVGREYRMLRTIVAHPFIGIRAALIYKHTHAKYFDQIPARTLKDAFTASDNFWGIGPRLGVDLQFNMRRGWSLLGNLSGALFFGSFDLREEISTRVTTQGVLDKNKYHVKDNRFAIRANLDTALGIGWETWFKEHSVRLAPSVMFEASCWFDTNQLLRPKPTPTTLASPDFPIPFFNNFRRQGNLILMGFSFNLQADF